VFITIPCLGFFDVKSCEVNLCADADVATELRNGGER